MVSLILDVLLVAHLTATICYCYILNRRIKTLQDGKSELAGLLARFDESTIKASETIVAMQTASKKIGDNIQGRIDKANYVLEDLAYSIDKGTKVTSQLEAGFAIARAKSRTEHQLSDPLPLDAFAEEPPPPHDKHKAAYKRSPASIEAIVDKVVSRKPHQEPTQVGGRSRAEQELIELIRGTQKG